jgi:hypothetical protein
MAIVLTACSAVSAATEVPSEFESARHAVPHNVPIADAAEDQASALPLELLRDQPRLVVQHGDLVTVAEQPRNQRSARKTGAASNTDFH